MCISLRHMTSVGLDRHQLHTRAHRLRRCLLLFKEQQRVSLAWRRKLRVQKSLNSMASVLNMSDSGVALVSDGFLIGTEVPDHLLGWVQRSIHSRWISSSRCRIAYVGSVI